MKDAYLDLLKLALTGLTEANPTVFMGGKGTVPLPPAQLRQRLEGRDWPANGLTMIGIDRLDHLQVCVEDVLEKEVPGDLIEAGVWRGGAAMLMRAILNAHSATDRTVFVADSFEGLPAPDAERYPADSELDLSSIGFLSVPLEEVRSYFERYGLLDDRVHFVKGWFRDTLPSLSDRTWAVIRLDGDLYESTILGLENLYPGLSVGGYAIIDDYGSVPACRQAVHDYFARNGMDEEISRIHATAYWQKRA